jgi:metal-sulfur cluster biosynthetic enzyme
MRGKTLKEAAWHALGSVLDPELDTPITELGFVSELKVDEASGHISLRLRLPTFWCAANFAYLMAHDARQVLLTLPGVRTVGVVLEDHFADCEITKGVNQGLRFDEVFPEEAIDDLEVLRRRFVEKAYLQRHEVLLRLLTQKLPVSQVLNLNLDDLLEDEIGLWVNQGKERLLISSKTMGLLHNYLSRRRALGLPTNPESPFALDPEGNLLSEATLEEYLKQCKTTRINITFNRALCERLLETRYGMELEKARR